MEMKYWIMAARPKTLPAGISPVLLALSFSYYSTAFISISTALFTLFAAMFLQIGTNLVNDYFDAKTGIDNEKRIGPVRVTQKGFLSPNQVKTGFIVCFIIAAGCGVPLVIKGGIPILVIGLLSIIFAYLYTGGPFPVSHYALGELFAFLFFGVIAVSGTIYLQTGAFSKQAFLLGMGPGFISALIMSINNLRDIQSDKKCGKTTISVLLGEKYARFFSISLLFLSCLVPIIFIDISYLVLVTIITPFLFLKNWINIISLKIGPEFNIILANTGKYLFLYSIVFSVGMLI